MADAQLVFCLLQRFQFGLALAEDLIEAPPYLSINSWLFHRRVYPILVYRRDPLCSTR